MENSQHVACLEDLAQNENATVRSVARLVIEAKQCLDSGKITLEEFNTIAVDIMEIDVVDDLMDTIDTNRRIKQAFDQIRLIVKNIIAIT